MTLLANLCGISGIMPFLKRCRYIKAHSRSELLVGPYHVISSYKTQSFNFVVDVHHVQEVIDFSYVHMLAVFTVLVHTNLKRQHKKDRICAQIGVAQ